MSELGFRHDVGSVYCDCRGVGFDPLSRVGLVVLIIDLVHEIAWGNRIADQYAKINGTVVLYAVPYEIPRKTIGAAQVKASQKQICGVVEIGLVWRYDLIRVWNQPRLGLSENGQG